MTEEEAEAKAAEAPETAEKSAPELVCSLKSGPS